MLLTSNIKTRDEGGWTYLEQLLAEDIPVIQLGLYTDCHSMFPNPASHEHSNLLVTITTRTMATYSICSKTSALPPRVLMLSNIFLALRLSCVNAQAS